MSRISRDQMFMMIAKAAALRSTCFRLNVGAVIVSNNRPVSIGYNGSRPGQPHCLGDACPGKFTCRETIHAEDNALRFLPEGVTGLLDMFVTHSPCPSCGFLLRGLGGDRRIRRVVFEVPYRDPSGLDELSEAVDLQQLTPAGYLIDWKTKNVIETP